MQARPDLLIRSPEDFKVANELLTSEARERYFARALYHLDESIDVPVFDNPTPDPNWLTRANCKGSNPRLFYVEFPPDVDLRKPETLDPEDETMQQIWLAKEVCLGCTERGRCLDRVMAEELNEHRQNVAGGLTGTERVALHGTTYQRLRKERRRRAKDQCIAEALLALTAVIV